ncbi:MAG TPA: M23 family metallopeptidase [Dermatophilaceae bacterium]
MKRAVIVAAIGGVCLLLLVVLLPLLLLQPDASACGTTAAPADLVAPAAGGGKAVGSYTAAQVSVAGQIVAAGKSLGVSPRGQTIGIMTGIGESGLAPINVGDSAGPDSRGVFQQRADGWGTYAQRMDPFQSAVSFFKAMITTPYDTMTPTAAAHLTQRNADPGYYTKFWPDAVMLYSQITGDPNMAAALAVPAVGAAPAAPVSCTPCPPAGGDYNGTDPGPGSQDPTTHLTPRLTALVAAVKVQFPEFVEVGTWRPTDPYPDHPSGRAADFMIPGDYKSPAGIAEGDKLADWINANAPKFGLQYEIWRQRDRNAGGDWIPMSDRGSDNDNHFTHVHATVSDAPAAGGANHDGPLAAPAAPCPAPAGGATGGFALPLPKAALTPDVLAKPHHDSPGADLPAPTGTPIYAVEGGTVTFAGPVQGFGDNFVAVKDAAGWSWYYGHGSSHRVVTGQHVNAGDQIASVGTEGFSTGPHLHLGLNAPGQDVPTTAPSYCPQTVLTALWDAQPAPDLGGLSTTACIGGHL